MHLLIVGVIVGAKVGAIVGSEVGVVRPAIDAVYKLLVPDPCDTKYT